ncbi:hypothetical protein H696_02043 [Fonticula alba]|uniref:Uncharacterized protein n=1 Tax=Fonticula alba TaxID=691883 RepID=A0A058ZAY3_FONAL|nr:hypothetical protein H696_02043 [Fonticula alba]KCV71096.1 hypothetical protein H696_02043 [Fonticula alba]|eukprot:XP_009494219.1 hypothetical protein H696_02043 [Fonticula alba]
MGTSLPPPQGASGPSADTAAAAPAFRRVGFDIPVAGVAAVEQPPVSSPTSPSSGGASPAKSLLSRIFNPADLAAGSMPPGPPFADGGGGAGGGGRRASLPPQQPYPSSMHPSADCSSLHLAQPLVSQLGAAGALATAPTTAGSSHGSHGTDSGAGLASGEGSLRQQPSPSRQSEDFFPVAGWKAPPSGAGPPRNKAALASGALAATSAGAHASEPPPVVAPPTRLSRRHSLWGTLGSIAGRPGAAAGSNAPADPSLPERQPPTPLLGFDGLPDRSLVDHQQHPESHGPPQQGKQQGKQHPAEQSMASVAGGEVALTDAAPDLTPVSSPRGVPPVLRSPRSPPASPQSARKMAAATPAVAISGPACVLFDGEGCQLLFAEVPAPAAPAQRPPPPPATMAVADISVPTAPSSPSVGPAAGARRVVTLDKTGRAVPPTVVRVQDPASAGAGMNAGGGGGGLNAWAAALRRSLLSVTPVERDPPPGGAVPPSPRTPGGGAGSTTDPALLITPLALGLCPEDDLYLAGGGPMAAGTAGSGMATAGESSPLSPLGSVLDRLKPLSGHMLTQQGGAAPHAGALAGTQRSPSSPPPEAEMSFFFPPAGAGPSSSRGGTAATGIGPAAPPESSPSWSRMLEQNASFKERSVGSLVPVDRVPSFGEDLPQHYPHLQQQQQQQPPPPPHQTSDRLAKKMLRGRFNDF